MTLTKVFLLAGCLMRVSDAEVRQQIVESVKSFYSCVTRKQLLDGTDRPTKPKPWTFHSDNRFSRLSLSEALSGLLWWHACVFVSLFLSLFHVLPFLGGTESY